MWRIAMKRLSLWMLCLTMVLVYFGCQESVVRYDPEKLAAARKQFLLEEEPEGVEGVLDVQENYQSPREVVLVGQIGGVANPWTPGKAAFILADPIALLEIKGSATDHVCSDPGCKFCAKQKVDQLKEGLAAIEFQDDQGQVLPMDARNLFGVAEKQVVVVRGEAHVNALGCLVVAADGLYVRR